MLALRVAAALRESGTDADARRGAPRGASTETRRLVVLGHPPIARLGTHGLVDAIEDFGTGGWHELYAEPEAGESFRPGATLAGSLARLRREGPFGRVVHMGAGEGSARAARRLADALEAPFAVAIESRPEPGVRRHVTEQWLERLRAAGAIPSHRERDADPDADCASGPGPAPTDGADRTRPRILVPPSMVEDARARLRAAFGNAGGERIAILHAGSGGAAKCAPLPLFLACARALRDEGTRVACLVGPVEEERWASGTREALASAGPFARPASSEELAATLAAADLVVANDSGVAHVAAAVGTPVVAIFGPTDPAVWGPLGPRVETVGGCGVFPDETTVVEAAIRQGSIQPPRFAQAGVSDAAGSSSGFESERASFGAMPSENRAPSARFG